MRNAVLAVFPATALMLCSANTNVPVHVSIYNIRTTEVAAFWLSVATNPTPEYLNKHDMSWVSKTTNGVVTIVYSRPFLLSRLWSGEELGRFAEGVRVHNVASGKEVTLVCDSHAFVYTGDCSIISNRFVNYDLICGGSHIAHVVYDILNNSVDISQGRGRAEGAMNVTNSSTQSPR